MPNQQFPEYSNKSRLQRAAENAMLALVSRWLIVLICATGFPAATYVGKRLIDQMDRQAEQINQLVTDVAVMKSELIFIRQQQRAGR